MAAGDAFAGLNHSNQLVSHRFVNWDGGWGLQARLAALRPRLGAARSAPRSAGVPPPLRLLHAQLPGQPLRRVGGEGTHQGRGQP